MAHEVEQNSITGIFCFIIQIAEICYMILFSWLIPSIENHYLGLFIYCSIL